MPRYLICLIFTAIPPDRYHYSPLQMNNLGLGYISTPNIIELIKCQVKLQILTCMLYTTSLENEVPILQEILHCFIAQTCLDWSSFKRIIMFVSCDITLNMVIVDGHITLLTLSYTLHPLGFFSLLHVVLFIIVQRLSPSFSSLVFPNMSHMKNIATLCS